MALAATNLDVSKGDVYVWAAHLKEMLQQTKLDVFAFFKRAWEYANHTGDKYRTHAAQYNRSLHSRGEPFVPGFVRIYIQKLESGLAKIFEHDSDKTLKRSVNKKPKAVKRHPAHRQTAPFKPA